MTVLSLSHIRFTRDERLILNDLSWSVAPGQIAAVVGPNGCGKSTLMRLISGYLWPTSGTIQLLGQTLGEYPIAKLRARIGLVEAQAVYPFDDDMTALDVVCSGYFGTLTLGYVSPPEPTAEHWSHAQHCLTQVALGDRADQLYSTLSTGQRMRTLIARALVKKPELVLFDEPTAGLDLPAREAVLATLLRLHSPQKTNIPPNPIQHSEFSIQHLSPPAIIIVTHHLDELLPGTSNVLLINSRGGTQACGAPQDVLTDAHMSAAFNWPIHVQERHGRYHAHVDPQSWSELL
ncbi:MAG: ATP-binding cassette domain-containing protein [Phycisphaerae bacterium]